MSTLRTQEPSDKKSWVKYVNELLKTRCQPSKKNLHLLIDLSSPMFTRKISERVGAYLSDAGLEVGK